jgi:mono/diheme cytochrome c family protein
LLAAGCLSLSTHHLAAQSIATSSPEPGRSMNEQQVRGEGLFLQRCSLCHLTQAKRLRPDSRPYGPSLTSLLRDAGAAKEQAVREIILQGGPRMPGFQYGFTAEQMDDLMAFLKTL